MFSEGKMAIILPRAPKLEWSLLELHLLQITKSTAMGPPGQLLKRRPESLYYLEPHRNYLVTLDEITKGQMLTVAKRGTWRYLITDEKQGIGEIELASSLDEHGDEVVERFVAINHSEAAQSTLDALNSADSSGVVQDDDYEVRFLKISALYFEAVWLHSKNNDILIPIFDKIKSLRKGNAYSESDIISVLQPLALSSQQIETEIESRSRGLR
jgi:hypothetical protein